MQPSPIYYDRADYIDTLNGNKINRKSVLCGIVNIRLHGKTIIKTGATIRGDLANVIIGRLSVIGENVVVRPSYKRFKGSITFFPLTIGDNVFVGDDTVIAAASIGSCVHIGKNCVIAKQCILKDCCRIPDNTVLPPNTVVPPFTTYTGDPTRIEELPESFQEVMKEYTMAYYESFQAAPS
jgi:dynactin-5